MWKLFLVQRKRVGFEMSRLITFGDSFTFGHWLESTDNSPSDRAWPKLLGDMLAFDTINKGVPGHSNIQILQDILNFQKFEESDIVIIAWSYVERDCIFQKNSTSRISPWIKNKKLVMDWLSIHNDYDMSVRAGLYMHHAESYLKLSNVKQLHFSAWQNQSINEVRPIFTKSLDNFIYENILVEIDKALDNDHPGFESHKQTAEKLYRIINESK